MKILFRPGFGPTSITRCMEGEGGGQGNGDGGQNSGGGSGTGDAGSGSGDGSGNSGGGTQTPWDTFIARVPESHRQAPSILKFKEHEDPVSALASSYVSAEQLIGRDKIPMPKTDEEYRETFKRLGMPDTPEGYNLEHGLENTTPQEAFELERQKKWFPKIIHELGLTKAQGEKLYKLNAQNLREQVHAMNTTVAAELNKGIAVLRDEWGQKFDSNMTLANRAIEFAGGKEVIDIFANTGVGRHPAVVKMMKKVGDAFAEEMGIDKNTGDYLEHGDTLQGKIDTLMHSPAYSDKTNPAHKATVAEVTRLMERKWGTDEIGTQARGVVFSSR